jgi:hypothetical protein
MKKYTQLIFLVLMSYSCKTQQLYINIVEPAPVSVPANIKTVGIIDRSLPSDQTKKLVPSTSPMEYCRKNMQGE